MTIKVDAAIGESFTTVGRIVKACKLEDSSGLRRCILNLIEDDSPKDLANIIRKTEEQANVIIEVYPLLLEIEELAPHHDLATKSRAIGLIGIVRDRMREVSF